MKLAFPAIVRVAHSLRLQKLRAIHVVLYWVHAEAEVLGHVHCVVALVLGAFVVGVESLGLAMESFGVGDGFMQGAEVGA